MAWPDDPRDIKVGFAFGHSGDEDPSGLTYEQVSPNPDDEGDPGPVLGTIRIQRGRLGDAGTTDPTQIETALRDPDGRFSRRNVTGPYYGQLRQGTPMQVTVDVGSGDIPVATAYVPSWSPTWRGPGIDDRVPITALGRLARLSEDDEVRSALWRTINGVNATTHPVAYYPMDTAASGTTPMGARYLSGAGIALEWVTEQISPALAQGWSSAGRDVWVRPVNGRETASAATIDTTVTVDSVIRARPTDDTSGFTINLRDVSGPSWFVSLTAAWDGGSPSLFVRGANVNPIDTAAASSANALWDEGAHHVRIVLEQDGSDVDVTVYLDGEEILSGTETSATIAGTFVPGLIVANRAQVLWSDVIVWTDDPTPVADIYAAVRGYPGETAADRLARTAAEAGIPLVIQS